MYAIYYICPETGRHYACVSGRHMEFVHADDHVADSVCGALFDRAENAQAAIRAFGRIKIEQQVAAGHPPRFATLWNEGTQEWDPLPGSDDPSLKNFRIVPMVMKPNFDAAIQITASSRRKKP